MAQTIAGIDADFTYVAVPLTARMPKLALMMSFWAICSALFWMVVAGTLALTFGAVNAITALLMAVATFSLINGVIARFAIERGLSVALFSKVVFGSLGADLATLLLFVTATWYAVFEGSVVAQAFHIYIGVSINNAYLLVVSYSVVLMIGGIQSWLDKLNGTLLPFYLAGLVGAIVLAIKHYGFSSAWLRFTPAGEMPPYGWLKCYAVYLGVWSMMMFTLEYARFGRHQDLAYHKNITFGWAFYIFSVFGNGLVGIFLVASVPLSGPLSEVAVVDILLKLMGGAGLLFVWVSQTRINTANFYVAALNLASILHRLGWHSASRLLCATFVGGVVLLIMRIDIFSVLLKALAYQGVLIEAWVSIALVYMLSSRRGRSPSDNEHVIETPAQVGHMVGLLAWLGATVIGIAMLNTGPALSLCSAPATALAAASFYFFGRRVASRRTRIQTQG